MIMIMTRRRSAGVDSRFVPLGGSSDRRATSNELDYRSSGPESSLETHQVCSRGTRRPSSVASGARRRASDRATCTNRRRSRSRSSRESRGASNGDRVAIFDVVSHVDSRLECDDHHQVDSTIISLTRPSIIVVVVDDQDVRLESIRLNSSSRSRLGCRLPSTTTTTIASAPKFSDAIGGRRVSTCWRAMRKLD